MVELTLAREGLPISRERVRTSMRRMGLRAHLTRSPRNQVPVDPSEALSLPGGPQRRSRKWNQVWATDITYIALRKASSTLVAVVDACFPACTQWKLTGSLDTRISAWRPWRWLFAGGRKATDLPLRSGVSWLGFQSGRRNHPHSLREILG